MNIQLATQDDEIRRCYSALRALRPHIQESNFLENIKTLQRFGYRLATIERDNLAVSVAGFRLGVSLAWGQYLYVEDLVTLPDYRSLGLGAKLLQWLFEFATAEGCAQFHLDSGVQREDAHRFYKREQMQITSYHFSKKLAH